MEPNKYTYLKEEKAVRELPKMEKPECYRDNDSDYDCPECKPYSLHIASLRTIPLSSVNPEWIDGMVLEEGKDITIQKVRGLAMAHPAAASAEGNDAADQIHELYKNMEPCPLKAFLGTWFSGNPIKQSSGVQGLEEAATKYAIDQYPSNESAETDFEFNMQEACQVESAKHFKAGAAWQSGQDDAVGFAEFIDSEMDVYLTMDKHWKERNGEKRYAGQELYTLYLQSKTKK